MAKKKKSESNKIVPVLLLAAILGGGYYLYTSNDSSSTALTMPGEAVFDVLVEPIVQDKQAEGDSLQVQTSNTIDTLHGSELADSEVPQQPKQPENQTRPNAKTQNAYTDEYGNVIYTQPNGVSPIKYKTAKMGRWGYSIKYPAFLTNNNHNADGSTFSNGKGLTVSTYASWNVFNESISELYRKDLPDVKSVTYKKLLKKQNAYVKSGYTTDNKVFYLKEVIFERDGQEEIASLIFYYPKSYQKEADKIIKEIFDAFPLR